MAQSDTVALPKRLPLVVAPENRDASTAKDSRLVNCYVEKDDNGDYHVYKRPGLTADSQPSGGAATGRGVYNWLGDVYSIFDTTMYKNGVALVGVLNATNGLYRFSECLGGTPKMQFGDGVKGYNYNTASGIVVISDPDFPTTFCKGWAYLDGTTYIIRTTAHVLGDDINDPTSWDPLNDILAQIEPDPGVAMAKQLIYVIALKQWSTEVFYDAGNATGSPLGRVEGAKVNWGCVSQDSVRDVDGSLFWICSNKSSLRQVIKLESLKAQIVSTPAVERLIQTADFSTTYSWVMKSNGHRFYIFTAKLSNLTLAYDVDENMWWQMTDTNGNYMPIVDSTVNSSAVQVLQHESNGRLYTVSNSVYTDAGDLITVDVYTPNFDGGTRRRKQMNRMGVVADQQVGSVLQVRHNDHDYDPKKWSNFRTLDLSLENPYLSNCGMFKRRAHNYRHRCNTAFRMQAVDLQLDVGTL